MTRTLTAFGLTIALLGISAGSVFAQSIGVVKRSSGQVALERGDVQLPASAGTEVLRGDRLVTGPDGYATIHMRITGHVTVGPQTEVPLDRYAGDPQPVAKKRLPAVIEGLASFLAVNRQR